jgi:hypothetical protein
MLVVGLKAAEAMALAVRSMGDTWRVKIGGPPVQTVIWLIQACIAATSRWRPGGGSPSRSWEGLGDIDRKVFWLKYK